MITETQKNMAAGFIVIFSIGMYDVLLDILDSLRWSIEILLEWIELTIERVILHFFHITHHQSEIITSYIMLFIGLIILYRLWRAFPRLYRKLKRNLHAAWLRQKRRTSYYWRHLPVIHKIKLITICTTGFTGLIFII